MWFACSGPPKSSYPSWNKIQTSFHDIFWASAFLSDLIFCYPLPCLLRLAFLFNRLKFVFCCIEKIRHFFLQQSTLLHFWQVYMWTRGNEINKEKAFYRWRFMVSKLCHWIWLEKNPTFFSLTSYFLGYPHQIFLMLSQGAWDHLQETLVLFFGLAPLAIFQQRKCEF